VSLNTNINVETKYPRHCSRSTESKEKMPRIKPLGQPPKVWKLIEKMDKDGKLIKFTIQEIPEDRYEDTVQHMCTYFLADEPICNYLGKFHRVSDYSITLMINVFFNNIVIVRGFKIEKNEKDFADYFFF